MPSKEKKTHSDTVLTIYKASAGSGKTYTLTYEYIRTLLGIKQGNGGHVLNSAKYIGTRRSCRHRSILAITFTNAATEEMKTRIVKELHLLSTGSEDAEYTGKLMQEFGCTGEELCVAARIALGELLLEYSGFNVSTIDSFFQAVLRTFAREIDQQGDYELTLDQSDAISRSIALMLDELNYSSPVNSARIKAWIKDYMFDLMSGGSGYNFFDRSGQLLGSLTRKMKDALNEDYHQHSDEIKAYLADPASISTFVRDLREKIKGLGADSEKAAKEFFTCLSSLGCPENIINSTVLNRLYSAIDNPRALISAKEEAKAFFAVLNSDEVSKKAFHTTNMGKLKMKIDSPEVAEIYAAMRRAVCAIHRERVVLGIYRVILQGTLELDFVGLASDFLEKYLKENNLVLISDTGDLLNRIISEEDTPFIYERLGMSLSNFLIDEFQDTSRMQWENLRPLVGNSLGFDHENLIIGDEKQSIYRFRNSDSSLLGYKIAEYDFPGRIVPKGFLPEENTNYRSAGDIVRFNNTVFKHMSAILGVSGYGNVVQTPCRKYSEQAAHIKFQWGRELNEETMEEMAQVILQQHESGYRWHDILILVRKKAEARKIVEFMVSKHPEIRVLSNEALLVNSSPAVRTVMSMLKLVEKSYSTERDRGEKKYSTRADVVAMISRYDYYRNDGLDKPEALRMALEDVTKPESNLNGEIFKIRAENPANLVALIEAIIHHKLSEKQRHSEHAYIAALQDLAQQHVEGPDPSISAFIAAYDRNTKKWAIQAPSNLDAVEIMTIHKSKGLERACVHIPAADWDLVGKTDLWMPLKSLDGFKAETVPPMIHITLVEDSPLADKKYSPLYEDCRQAYDAAIADNLNLLYVAFTRASRELHVWGASSASGKGMCRPLIEALASAAATDTGGDSSLLDMGFYFSPEEKILEIGCATKPEKKHVESSETITAEAYNVVLRKDTRELISIDDILSLDIGDEEDKFIVDRPKGRFQNREMEIAARRGNNLHNILASMRVLDDLDAAVTRTCLRLGLSEIETEEYRGELAHAIEQGGEQVKSWFDPTCRVYAERSITDRSSSDVREHRTFRPDRVVISPDGKAIVVDYKFTSAIDSEHKEQVEGYIRLLNRLGRRNVEGYLWYPLLGQIIKVQI